MWCCSRTAKLFFDSVVGGDEFTSSSDSDGVTTRNHRPGGSSSNPNNKARRPEISLDSGYLGREVLLVKHGLRICGTGGALGSAPLVQTKSYFEIKIQQDGVWSVGVSTRKSVLDTGPFGEDTESWVLRNNGQLFHNGQTIGSLENLPSEGDVIGITYDHIELCFYINGQKEGISFQNVRGTVFPALFVKDGAVIDAIFEGFIYPPSMGFEKIMKEKSLL